MASQLYTYAEPLIRAGEIDLVNDPIHVALMRPDYTFHPTGQRYWLDVMNDEVRGPGYTPGGKLVSIQRAGFDEAGVLFGIEAGAVIWPAVSLVLGSVVLYKQTDQPESAVLLAYAQPNNIDGPIRLVTTMFTINWTGSFPIVPIVRQPPPPPKERVRRRRLVLG